MDFSELPTPTTLRALEAVVRLGSAGAGARELGISREAVNSAILRLEKRLGHSLFTRTGKRLHATALCSELIRLNREYITRIQDLFASSEDVSVTRDLRLCAPTYLLSYMAHLLAEIPIDDLGLVNLELVAGQTSDDVRGSHIALVCLREPFPGYSTRVLGRETLTLLLPLGMEGMPGIGDRLIVHDVSAIAEAGQEIKKWRIPYTIVNDAVFAEWLWRNKTLPALTCETLLSSEIRIGPNNSLPTRISTGRSYFLMWHSDELTDRYAYRISELFGRVGLVTAKRPG